jgi:hypothetical protein
MLQIDPF